MVLPVHLEGDDHIVFDDSNAGDAEQRPSIPDPVSKLELYFHRPDHYAEKKNAEYWEQIIWTPQQTTATDEFQVSVR